MTDSKKSTASIDVSTSSLLRLLNDVKPFACTDDTLPMINAVAFEFAGDDLVAMATDRYTLGVGRLPVGEAKVMPTRMVRLADVVDLLKAFKPARGIDPMLCIEFGEEALAVATTATLDGEPTHRRAYRWYDGTPVPWRKLLDTGTPTGDVASASFNPSYMAKFVQVQRNDEPMRVHISEFPNKPWRVTIGDHFIGLIMPVRNPDSWWTPSELNQTPVGKPLAKPRARRAAKKSVAA